MSSPVSCRNRFVYALATVAVIAAGLASRRWSSLFPDTLRQYPGDALWALMVFCALGAVFPRLSIGRLAACALGTCFVVELSQLYRAPWLDAIRDTTLGHLALGRGFQWGDLVAYSLGVALGAGGERVVRPTLAAPADSASIGPAS